MLTSQHEENEGYYYHYFLTRKKIVRMIKSYSIWKHLQKNSLLSTQSLIYLGVELNSATMRAKLSPARVDALNSAVTQSGGAAVSDPSAVCDVHVAHASYT